MRVTMLLQRLALGFCAASTLGVASEAQEADLSIMTGPPSGTYHQIGEDLDGLMQQCGRDLEVVESEGSLENLLAIRQRRNTQFGIVQSDVLEYMQTFAGNDRDVARTIAGVRVAFPLYDEEVHVLARRDIAAFDDLGGKRVAIGTENSGTYLTASLMLSLAGVEPAEVRPIAPDDALPLLAAGELDAFFHVAGAPAELYAEGGIDAAEFHLLPIQNETLRAAYTPATLAGGTYPFQPEPVEVVAVKAVLMTYEFDARGNLYQQGACRGVSDLSSLILSNLGTLRSEGHPKWQSVDFTDVPPGWEIAACVNRGIDPGYQSSCAAATPEAGPAPEAAAQPEAEAEVSSGSPATDAFRRSICARIGC